MNRPSRPYREPLFNPLELLIGVVMAAALFYGIGGAVWEWPTG